MDEINKEIEQMAEKMEKSQKDPVETLKQTVRSLGPEGLKKAIPNLSDDEKVLLKDVLEDMNKAVEMDDAYAAKFVEGNINDTKIQEDKADDDADEKLVKPEAANHNHQGDVTPEGREGQIIKAKDCKDEAKKEVKEHEDKMHKDGKKKMEKCDMKKSELLEVKAEAEEILKSEGAEITDELVKSKMKELIKGRMLKEEEQSEDKLEDMHKDKDRGDKARPEALKVEKENKDAQDKVDKLDQGKMKKAIFAGENDLLKARTGGRNHHFSVNGYYDQVIADAEKPAEEIKKSETPEENYDLNDLIEKDMTKSWGQIQTENGLAKSQEAQNGKLVKSFQDNDIASALGLTEDQAKKILGE